MNRKNSYYFILCAILVISIDYLFLNKFELAPYHLSTISLICYYLFKVGHLLVGKKKYD